MLYSLSFPFPSNNNFGNNDHICVSVQPKKRFMKDIQVLIPINQVSIMKLYSDV